MTHDPGSWWLDERAHAGREHFDEQHARRYDAKMDAGAAEEVALLQAAGVLGARSSVVEIGTGTGQFALAAAAVCERVVAVDVSPVMLARLEAKREAAGASNVEIVQAGFLSYEHEGAPADVIYSRWALHHLPDFWKAMALRRVRTMLRPGGVFRLWDVVYSFDIDEADERIEQWCSPHGEEVEGDWARWEMEEHVRDEHSTFTWLLESMFERTGFGIEAVEYADDGFDAKYLLRAEYHVDGPRSTDRPASASVGGASASDAPSRR